MIGEEDRREDKEIMWEERERERERGRGWWGWVDLVMGGKRNGLLVQVGVTNKE
jgi:hypothetical protein